jgi:hypothetical protein
MVEWLFKALQSEGDLLSILLEVEWLSKVLKSIGYDLSPIVLVVE